jgi:hypothetical protein
MIARRWRLIWRKAAPLAGAIFRRGTQLHIGRLLSAFAAPTERLTTAPVGAVRAVSETRDFWTEAALRSL